MLLRPDRKNGFQAALKALDLGSLIRPFSSVVNSKHARRQGEVPSHMELVAKEQV
jgi:hypothetical protein